MGLGYSGGVHFTTVKSLVRDEEGSVVKCVPETTYTSYPAHRRKAPGSLILEFKALPKQCYIGNEPVGMYWWTDAQFLPHVDCSLFVTTGAYIPRTNHAWVKKLRIPSGRIIRYDIDQERLRGEVFRLTNMSNYPRIHMHPSGKYIGYVGVEGVKIETITHDDVYLKHKDLRSSNYRYCEFSPNGKYIAILLSVSKKFELLLSRVDKALAIHDRSTDLSHHFPGFQGSNAFNEHLECKWSPDSQYIIVNSSIGFLVVLDVELLNPVVNVFSEILPGLSSSTAGSFDVCPKSCHQLLAIGTSDRCVYIINIIKEEIVVGSECLASNAIDCLLFTPDGLSILVAFRDFTLLLCCSETLAVTFKLDMCIECPDIAPPPGGAFPGVTHVSFSMTGEQVAVSTCDGVVRLWQMPCNITLQELCRRSILSNVPVPKVRELPLPSKLREALVDFPTEQ